MKSKRILTCSIAVFISLAAIFTFSAPIVKGNGDTIPTEYCQQLDLNGTYVYNVTAFGGPAGWWDLSYTDRGTFATNPGGQIMINFTGFYNRDPVDFTGGDLFPDTNMPWMDVEIFKNGAGSANFSRNNCSNSEAAQALTLNYGEFKSGFLVPMNNFTRLKELATLGADWEFGTAKLTFEETKSFIYLGFTQIGGGQKTDFIYEKTSGLLIWANTSAYGYQLEIKSLNFTLDYETDYKYDVLKFNEPKEWYNLTGALDGNFKSNPTGLISINFTGDYVKDPNDLNNVFEDPIPWIDLAIIENNSGLLNTNFTLNNRSNGEVARELVLSFNNFLSGFRISLDNLSNIKALAIQQAGGVINGNVSILESNLTISFDFNSTYQNTTITYEKLSGLLLWSNTTKSNYLLEIAIRANNTLPYIAPGTGGPPLNPGDIVFLPYLIVIIASVAIVVPFEFTPRASSKTKKFVFIAMIAVSSFSALFFFNNNMDVLFPAQAEGKVDNITLIVDYGNTTIDTFGPFSLEGGNTYIINAVEKWCDTTMIGNFIDEINGYKPPDGWMYSVNEIYVGSVTSTALKSGDVIRFYPA